MLFLEWKRPPYLFLAIRPKTTPFSFLRALNAVSRTSVVFLLREGTKSPWEIQSWRRASEAVILSSGFTFNCKKKDDCCVDAWTINFNKYKIIELAENKQLGTTNGFKYSRVSFSTTYGVSPGERDWLAIAAQARKRYRIGLRFTH